MERIVCLSTIDNPWNPVTNFEEWNIWDGKLGYSTCSYLARMVDLYNLNNNVVFTNLSEVEQQSIIETVIDDIVKHNPTDKYIKIVS